MNFRVAYIELSHFRFKKQVYILNIKTYKEENNIYLVIHSYNYIVTKQQVRYYREIQGKNRFYIIQMNFANLKSLVDK